MSEQVDQHYQSQHHFLSDSPWSAQAAMQKAAEKCNQLLGGWRQQSLGIDESSTRKAGKCSVGVGSQYNGNLGKVENSQTGVFASLSHGNRVGLINCRLFLPDDWVNNAVRCKKAGVPKAAMVKKTKIDLALDMIRENIDAGIQFGGGNADGLYGNSYHFCSSIEDMGKDFVVDIHKDQRVYLSDPQPYLPGAISQKGRKPSRLKTDEPPVMVEDYQVRKYNAWYHHQALVMMAMDYINETKT